MASVEGGLSSLQSILPPGTLRFIGGIQRAGRKLGQRNGADSNFLLKLIGIQRI
jgi:hypothetical protein